MDSVGEVILALSDRQREKIAAELENIAAKVRAGAIDPSDTVLLAEQDKTNLFGHPED